MLTLGLHTRVLNEGVHDIIRIEETFSREQVRRMASIIYLEDKSNLVVTEDQTWLNTAFNNYQIVQVTLEHDKRNTVQVNRDKVIKIESYSPEPNQIEQVVQEDKNWNIGEA